MLSPPSRINNISFGNQVKFYMHENGYHSLPLLRKTCSPISVYQLISHIAEHAFGNKRRVVIAIFTYIKIYLIATWLLIIEEDNLDNLFPIVNIRFEIWGLTIDGSKSFMLIMALVALPNVC